MKPKRVAIRPITFIPLSRIKIVMTAISECMKIFTEHTGFEFKSAQLRGDLEALLSGKMSYDKENAYEWIGDFALNYCVSR